MKALKVFAKGNHVMRSWITHVPACRWRTFISAAALVALGCASVARAEQAVVLQFVGHGAFFSRETHQATPIDPQVFVRSAGALAGVGPQKIEHAAGFSPVKLADGPSTPLYTAAGLPLHFTLRQWLGARGVAHVDAIGDGRYRVSTAFEGLMPNAHYSVFKVTFAPSGNAFAPLDGKGVANSFVATEHGSAKVTVIAPAPLTHDNAIVLVYHSDVKDHGMSRGVPGVNAHHQLVAKLP